MTKRIVLLQALASTPQDISRLVGKLDDEAAAWRPEGGWSCRDVVGHLCYVERLYLARIRRVAEEDEPAVEAIHPNESAHDTETPVAGLARQFNEAREMTLATLQELSPGAWQRAAWHESKGRMTLRWRPPVDGPDTMKTAFILCGALAREVLAIVNRNGWRVDLYGIPAIDHMHPERIAPEVPAHSPVV
jgi:uncharacterized damage-inducible protein DinB